MVVGAYIRLDDLKVWDANKQVFYFKDRPLFTSYDAFIFARYGKEFFEGKYRAGGKDPLRFVPDNYLTDNVTYPKIVPMSSFWAGLLAKLFNTHIENVDKYFTPLLSVLFVMPLVLFFWNIELPIAGFCGALVGSLSFIYLIRTSILRFDTDSLNLFFPLAIAYFLYLSLASEGKRQWVYLLLAGVCGQLYYWWYAHPGIILVLLFLYWLLAFAQGKFNKLGFGLSLLFFNPLVIGVGILNLAHLIQGYLISYFQPVVEGGFPNVQMSISELRHYDIVMIARTTCGNIIVFVVGLAFALLMFWKRVKDLLLLFPIFLIGLMALKGGNRFGMYLAPFIGAGVGYFFDETLAIVKRRGKEKFTGYPVKFLLIVVLGVILSFANKSAFSFTAYPRITPQLFGDFLKLREVTSEDAWIWTWWDYGYAIQYLSERGVFHDGGSQNSPKTYFVATTFSTSDPALANRVIKAIANIGVTGIKRMLEEDKKDPQQIRDEVFSGKYSAKLKHPVFWAFTQDLVGKFMWINYFGTWDFSAKKGLRRAIVPLSNCSSQAGGNVIVCAQGVFDIKNGYLIVGNKKVLLKSFVIRGKSQTIKKNYHDAGYYLEGVETPRGLLLYVTTEQPFNSMFNQMYILRNYDKRYFELVYDDFPTMVLYKVKD